MIRLVEELETPEVDPAALLTELLLEFRDIQIARNEEERSKKATQVSEKLVQLNKVKGPLHAQVQERIRRAVSKMLGGNFDAFLRNMVDLDLCAEHYGLIDAPPKRFDDLRKATFGAPR